jgi:hypothetical protein
MIPKKIVSERLGNRKVVDLTYSASIFVAAGCAAILSILILAFTDNVASNLDSAFVIFICGWLVLEDAQPGSAICNELVKSPI